MHGIKARACMDRIFLFYLIYISYQMDSNIGNELEEGEIDESTTKVEGHPSKEDKTMPKQIDSEKIQKQTTTMTKHHLLIKPAVLGNTCLDPRAKKMRIPTQEEIRETSKRQEEQYNAKIQAEDDMDPMQLLDDLIEKEEESERSRIRLVRAADEKNGTMGRSKFSFDSPMGSPCWRRVDPLTWHGYDGGGEKGKGARREEAIKKWQKIQDRKERMNDERPTWCK